MRPWLKWLIGIGAVLIAAVVLVVILFDWNWLRGPLESRLSAATGKQVRIVGPIHGEYKWTPLITIEGIKIADPKWKPDPEVAGIDRVEAAVELKKLLMGKLSIPTLTIDHPVAHLIRRNGQANWDIAREATGPSNRHNVPMIGDVTVNNGLISFEDVDKHISLQGTLSLLKGNGGPGGQPFTLEGHGTYQHAPFTLKLTGDSLEHMRERNEPYKVDVAADLGRTHLKAAGTIADPIKMTGIAIGLQLRGDNAADLFPYVGIPAPITPPYQIAGTFDRIGKDIYVFRDFGGKVGASDLEGSLSFDLGKPHLVMSGSLYSHALNLADLGLVFGVPTRPDDEPVAEHEKALRTQYEQSDRLIPDAPLQLSAVRNVDADITFQAAKVQAKDIPLDRIDLHVKIAGGVLSLDPVQVGVAGGLLRGTSVIDARTDKVHSDSDLHFSEFQLQRFLKPQGGGEAAATGVMDGRFRFQGTGDSLRQALATANGTLSVVVADGSMSKLVASLMGLDVAKTLGVLISGDKKVPLRCFVTDFDIKQGTMNTRVLVMDTPGTTVNGSGTINLADETMDMSLKGNPKKATLSLRGPILIKGTFREPKIGVGAEAIARAGASAALGALLTPVAAVLSFIDAGKKYDTDCAGLETTARQDAASQPPVNKHPPAPRTAQRHGGQPAPQPGKPAPVTGAEDGTVRSGGGSHKR